MTPSPKLPPWLVPWLARLLPLLAVTVTFSLFVDVDVDVDVDSASALTPVVSTFPNGQARPSQLAAIHHPAERVALARAAGAAWNTMRLCAVADGVDLYPVGPRAAYRTYAEQQYFWNLYVAGRGNLAARPGTSNHGWGRAIDLARPAMRAWIDRHGRAFGWAKVEAFSEWWHVNYVGGWSRPDPGVSQRYPVLRGGSGGRCQGRAVREVQRRLGLRQTGSYNYPTRRAVRRFQRTHGLHPHGVVTARTWSTLRARSRGVRRGNVITGDTQKPMVGEDVRALQGLLNVRLAEYGRAAVTVDGVLGRETIVALELFQRLRGRRATGVVDERMWRSLRTPRRSRR